MATPDTPQPQPLGSLLARAGEAMTGVADRARARAEEVRSEQARAATEAHPEPFGDDLDGWQLDDMLDDNGDVRSPDDDAQADQLLGVLAYLQRQKAKVARTADSRVAAIREWQADREAVGQRDIDRIEHRLEGWARAMHEASGGKAISWKLPNGTLRLAKARTKIHVLDAHETPDMLIRAGRYDVLNEHPVTYTVDKRAVADLAKDLGQGPPLSEQIGMPAGYTAHHIPSPGTKPADGEYLPGVYLLVPDQARNFEAQVS